MPRRRELRRSLWQAACFVAAPLFAVAAQAQVPARIIVAQPNAQQPLADQPNTDDASLGVFVRDSAVAADKLALAERMEKAHEWDTSAEVYQEVLDGFADRVVPTHFDPQGRPDRYGGVTSVIQDRIAAWPDAGREVYITRYAAPAAKLLESTDPNDRVALGRIADRYFVTDAGRDASLRLVELHFNAGEFASSAAIADRLLDHHPTLSDEQRPLLLLRSVIAWRLAGEPGRAKPRADALVEKFGDARAVLGGQEQSLAAAATAAVKPAETAARAEANGWRMPFGSPDHAAVAAEPDAPAPGQPPREWGKLLSFDLEQARPAAPGSAGDPEAEMASLRALIQRQRDLGATTGILPSIDGSQLFFQDNARVYARDLATGAPLPGWLASHPQESGAYKIDAPFTPRGAQMTVTLTDRYVLAILGQPDFAGGAMFGDDALGQRMGVARVVCLDRETGKPVWTRRMADAANAKATLDAQAQRANPNSPPARKAEEAPEATAAPPQPDPNQAAIVRGLRRRGVVPNAIPGANAPRLGGDESLRQTQPRGSALVVGDAVYVVARGGEPGAFEDCYLVCFGLADGEFRWARHLASGNASRVNFNGYPQASSNADSHLACVDGRIYVSTDMGAIAAVDAVDGALAWLALYPRPRMNAQQPWMNPNANVVGRVRPAFEGNPVIVRDGKVITIPADGEDLFVHDAVTGQEIARVPMKWRLTDGGRFADPAAKGAISDERLDEVNVLAGLAGDRLVVASPQAVSTLDWTKLRAGNPDDPTRTIELAPRDVVIRREEIRKPGFEDIAIRGRPFVTDRSIYVPTAWALYRLDLATGTALERYPANDDWQNRPDESAGNVTVVNGNVIVAGPERVSVYAGLGLVRQRLDAAIAAAPNAIAPRLRYAEAMANAGHNDEAMKWIDEAAGKVSMTGAQMEADRTALFDACATLVRNLNRPGRTPDPAFQAKLLTQVAAAATTPVQQVTARLLRGGLAAQAKDYPAAIEAYQSLIEEPTWATMRARVGDDATPIAQLAADAIKVLVATPEGRAAYEGIESRAAAALETARATNDPVAIFAIAERFPNARAAADAVRFSAELLTRSATGGGQPTLGMASLRKLAGGLSEPSARAALDEAMLRAYLATGDLPAALGRARRLAWTDPSRSLAALPALSASMATTVPTINASTAGELVSQLQQAVFAQQEANLPDLNANLDGDSFDAARATIVPNISSMLVPEALANTRKDRIVTIARDRSLKIFEPGAAEPLKTIPIPSVTDRTIVTWLPNDQLLLSQLSRVACVDVAGGKLAWTFDPSSLPATDDATQVASVTIDDAGLVALSPHAPSAPAAPLSPEEQQFEMAVRQGNMDPVVAQRLLRQQRLARQNFILRNRNGVVINQVAQQANGGGDADPRPDDDSKEAAAVALPVAGQSLIGVATTRGRIVALDAKTGELKWRLKVGDRAPGAFRAVGDMLVYVTTDESGSRVIVIDATSGQEVLRRAYGGGPAARVCNVGVSDEGWLAVVTGQDVQLFDILGGGSREPLATTTVPSETGMPPFATSRAPSHVQFCGGKLLVLADNVQPGMQGSPTVRSFELNDLSPTKIVGSKTRKTIERRFLPAFAQDRRLGTEQIELAVHKDRLYIMTGQFMKSFPVLDDDPADSAWSRVLPDQPSTLSLQSPMLVKEAVLLIGWPNDFVGQSAPAAHAELYSRQTYDGKHESGMCVEDAELSRRGEKIVDKFQPVNGGLYYITTKNSLVFLPGKPKP